MSISRCLDGEGLCWFLDLDGLWSLSLLDSCFNFLGNGLLYCGSISLHNDWCLCGGRGLSYYSLLCWLIGFLNDNSFCGWGYLLFGGNSAR